MLPLVFKEKTVQFLVACSIGHQNSAYFSTEEDSASEHRQSVSCERTFTPASRDEQILHSLLVEIVESLQEDAERLGIVGCGGVGLKLKSADFKVSTRERKSDALSRTLDWSLILKQAERLLFEFLDSEPSVRIRLLGVRLSKLKFANDPVEPSKSGTGLEKWLAGAKSGPLCPVCNSHLAIDENDHQALNSHLDECLTKAAIKDLSSCE